MAALSPHTQARNWHSHCLGMETSQSTDCVRNGM